MKRCTQCGRIVRPKWEVPHLYPARVFESRAGAEHVATARRTSSVYTGTRAGWQTNVTTRTVRARGQCVTVYVVTTRRAVPHTCDPAPSATLPRKRFETSEEIAGRLAELLPPAEEARLCGDAGAER